MGIIISGSSDNISANDGSWTATGLTIDSGTITYQTAQSVSGLGTAVTFSNIPSTAKNIRVLFEGVSTNGVNSVLIQLGTSSGITVSGYLSHTFGGFNSGTAGVNYTTGFGLDAGGSTLSAASIRHGCITISSLNSSDTWIASGNLGYSNGLFSTVIGGSVNLASTLTTIRITSTTGVDTFDAGTINICYEG